MAIEVLYEDNHLIGVNKKAGDITQGDKTGDETLPDKVKAWLKVKYDKPGNVFCGVIHRLDRPTSGIVMLAKTSKGLSRMNAMFQKKQVQKTYWAIVEDKPSTDSGSLSDYLKKNDKQNKSYVVNKSTPEAKHAELDFKLIASSDRYHLLEINPRTGRHHQIRTQLAHLGTIIKGDLKYGAKRSNGDGSISLHARKIQFTHPVSQESISITAPVPSDSLWKWFEKEIG
jgi:23S rRNA pseudouridine1911/1915/1917 synthase